MLTRFVRTQLIIFTIASIIGVAVMVFGYMQVPTLLGVGKITREAATACHRWVVPVRQRDLPRCAGGQGHRRQADSDDGAEATLSLNTSPKIPADLQASVLQHLRGRRAVCGSAAAHRLRTVSAGRFGDRGEGHHDSAAGRSHAGPGQQAGRAASPRTSSAICWMSRSRRSTAPGTTSVAARLGLDDLRRRQRGRRPDPRADR